MEFYFLLNIILTLGSLVGMLGFITEKSITNWSKRRKRYAGATALMVILFTISSAIMLVHIKFAFSIMMMCWGSALCSFVTVPCGVKLINRNKMLRISRNAFVLICAFCCFAIAGFAVVSGL